MPCCNPYRVLPVAQKVETKMEVEVEEKVEVMVEVEVCISEGLKHQTMLFSMKI